MKEMKLWFQLSVLPFKRSWVLHTALGFALVQIFTAILFLFSVVNEIQNTEQFAKDSKFVTLQMKKLEDGLETSPDLEVIRQKLKAFQGVSLEVLNPKEVLDRLQAEEPEVFDSLQAMGAEGVETLPRMVLIRGPISDDAVQELKLLSEVRRLDVSPSHHPRMVNVFRHLKQEVWIAFWVAVVMSLIWFFVTQRILERDAKEVRMNLLTWGASLSESLIPARMGSGVYFSSLWGFAIIEWVVLNQQFWTKNPFLGELSVRGVVQPPVALFAAGFLFWAVFSFLFTPRGKYVAQ